MKSILSLIFSTLIVVFVVSVVFGSGANDYPSGAGVISRNGVETGAVSSYDKIDWWKVYIPESGIFIGFLDGRQDNDIDLYLYDNDLNLLAQSTSDNEDEVVFGHIVGGWYYLKVAVCSSSGREDYDIGALFVNHSTGYLRATKDINLHSLYMSSSRVYWIFLVDKDGFFDPDLFLVEGNEILAKSQYDGDIDVIRWSPYHSGDYIVAVGSSQGSGYYYILVGSK